MGLVLLFSATMAWGSNLTDVRLGVHKDYTRVVFQLDGAAPYRLLNLRSVDDGTRILIVAIDANPAEIPVVQGGKSRQVKGVRVREASTGLADIRIRLRGDMELKEFVLRKPDRIVLDFFDAGAGVAPLASSLSPPPAVGSTAPAPTPVVEAEPEEPAPSPSAPPADELAEAPPELEPAPEAEPLTAEVLGAAEAAPEAPPEEEASDAFAGVEIAEVVQEEPAPVPPPSAAPLPDSGSSDSLLSSPVVLAAVAGLAVVTLLFVLGRRRGAREEESLSPLDRTDGDPPEGELFAEDEGVAYGASPEAEVMADEEPSEPAPFVDPPQDHDIEPEAAVAPPAPAPMEEAEMEQGFDLPGTPEAGQPVVPAPLSPSELGSGEVGKLVEEFERRIAHLENRLEEVVDAKERLERQVAAQTEELRVQRAAIARTQRVLRTIARPEDEISEPAPKP